MDNEPTEELDERDEAQVMDARIIDQMDTMLHILTQQIILTHNRALATRSLPMQHKCAELIATLTEHYLMLLTA